MRLFLKKTFLYTCWALGLFHLSKYLTKSKFQILCYHGFEIEDECSFRPKLFIKKATFANRLELISKYNFNVLPLDDALQKLRSNELPKNTVVITIDDGFYSTLSIAADMLNVYQYPATLYLTTYYVEKETPIFRLVVQYLFWKTDKHEVDFSDCVWNENKDSVTDLSNAQDRDGMMWKCIHYGEAHCTEPERVAICKQLGVLLDIDYQRIFDSRILSLLTRDEAREIAAKNINIQTHTHRHQFSTDDEISAVKEIDDNKEILSRIVSYPTNHFCYPSGIWNKVQWSWLEKKGIESATTCEPGLNSVDTPVYGLTRFLDGENISEIEFKAALFGFTECIRTVRKKIGG